MTRRRVFDPVVVPPEFWTAPEVQTSLASRDVGELFRAYLAAFPDCTQTQLALITEHDRADISNWVRGTRQGRVSDIDVLTRIADGLRVPDRARILLGLAPADMVMPAAFDDGDRNAAAVSAKSEPHDGKPRLAICGSRAPDCDQAALDASVRALARLVLSRGYHVDHGPVGIGIEVATFIADHYRPPDFRTTTSIFGRINIVTGADYIIAVGGGAGTRDELDLGRSLSKPVLTIPPTGGTAQRFHTFAMQDPARQPWLNDVQFAALDACASVDDYVAFIESVLTHNAGASL